MRAGKKVDVCVCPEKGARLPPVPLPLLPRLKMSQKSSLPQSPRVVQLVLTGTNPLKWPPALDL